MAINIFQKHLENLHKELTEHNQNRMIVLCGKTGKGKSMKAVKLGEALLPETFDVKKHVAYFKPRPFLKITKRAKPGSVVVFDEAGVGIDSREWKKRSNILITKVMQTFRTKNLFVLFTTPDFSFVDIKSRKLFHNFVSMRRIDYKKKLSYGRWYDIMTDDWEGNLWRRSMRVTYKGRTYETGKISCSLPSQDLIEQYEERRSKAVDNLYTEADSYYSGVDRAVTVEQAAHMLGMRSRELYNLIARGRLPVYMESSGLKIHLGLIKKVANTLNLDGYSRVIVTDKEGAKDKKRYELTDGLFLVVADVAADLILEQETVSV